MTMKKKLLKLAYSESGVMYQKIIHLYLSLDQHITDST